MTDNRKIIIWLYSIAFLVFAMVLIGGITRLTDSGLSMVDWKPLVGAIPPLNHSEWVELFNKYQEFPEYKLKNSGMNLSEFKSIFFWEYFHRLVGRFVGLVFLIPYLYFFFRKKLSKSLNKKLLISFILGGSQGLMGWYMVKSGLVDEPDVSHYRLAAHLGLAFIIISYLYWISLSLSFPKFKRIKLAQIYQNKTIVIFGAVLSLQILFGAFVAGLDAGLTHNTFPKMGRVWVPDTVFQFNGLDQYLHNLVSVQFIHRILAWCLLGLGLVIFFKRKTSNSFLQYKSKMMLVGILLIQFMLGVVTLLLIVPVSFASLHQIFGCFLLLCFVRLLFFTSHETQD